MEVGIIAEMQYYVCSFKFLTEVLRLLCTQCQSYFPKILNQRATITS